MAINWNEMGSFIKLPKGQPVRLLLKNWRQQEKFSDPVTKTLKFGLTFDVFKENNFEYEHEYDEGTKKEWTTTAIKACSQLKPIIEKAEASGKDRICVSIVVAGEGNKTVYTITEVPEV
jgi:hypothetical protein